MNNQFFGWRLPMVLNHQTGVAILTKGHATDRYNPHGYVGAQLPLRGVLRAGYQQPVCDYKTSGKNYDKPFSGLYSGGRALGSVITSICLLLLLCLKSLRESRWGRWLGVALIGYAFIG
ncbi:MAG TPA: hypothetical protein VEU32_11380, partial [Burkholderiales bacterium]|nr:hypothetical protein [Burkholderiales bacterium]